MKIGIFLDTAGIEKQNILKAFAAGIEKSNNRADLIQGFKYKKCDIAVIFGFYAKNLKIRQAFRKEIFTKHSAQNKRCVFIDADPLKFAGNKYPKTIDGPLNYFRISHRSIYPDEANYFNEHSPPDRWQLLQKEKQITVQPWQKNPDGTILICMNSDCRTGRNWSTKGEVIDFWLLKTIRKIRKRSKNPILVRFHPGGTEKVHKNRPWKKLYRTDNIAFSGGIVGPNHLSIKKGTSLVDDCKGASACIIYSTSAAVIPITQGIPVYAEKKFSLTYPISNKFIKNILNPIYFEREQWFNNLAYSCWNTREMVSGKIWKRISNRINLKGHYSKRKAALFKAKMTS